MQIFSLATLCFCIVALLIRHLTPARGWPMIDHYVMPLVFAFVGAVIMRKKGGGCDYIVCAALLLWYVISRVLLGELYLETSWQPFCRVAVCNLLAFPFAFGTDDGEKKTGLKWAATIYFVAMFGLSVLSIMVAVLGQPIRMSMFENGNIYMGEWDRRLYALDHPNISAALFMIALMLGFWLMCATRKRWIIVPGIVMCLCLYTAIGLCDSRTVMLQIGLCAALVIIAFLLHRHIPKAWVKAAVCIAAAVIMFVVCFFGFRLTNNLVQYVAESITAASAETIKESIISERSFLSDMATLTGRTTIYQNVLTMLKENPRVLWLGELEDYSLSMLQKYTGPGYAHTHNAYLETILFTGLPGALIAVYLTIRALWLSFKVVFLQKSTFTDKLLAAFVVTLLVSVITEVYLFTNFEPIYNFFFFLIFGYLAETERSLRVKKA